MLDHLFEPENKLMMTTLFPLLLLGCILVRRRSAQTQASVGSVSEQAVSVLNKSLKGTKLKTLKL